MNIKEAELEVDAIVGAAVQFCALLAQHDSEPDDSSGAVQARREAFVLLERLTHGDEVMQALARRAGAFVLAMAQIAKSDDPVAFYAEQRLDWARRHADET